jgi:hypothetical protein
MRSDGIELDLGDVAVEIAQQAAAGAELPAVR